MKPLATFTLVVSLFCGTAVGTLDHSSWKHECSRKNSREAVRIMSETVIPYAESKGLTLSPQCPFRPELSVFKFDEEEKQRVRASDWKCGYCGKRFRTEYYLDAHFDRQHREAKEPEGAVCLSDFCDVIGCSSDEFQRARESPHWKSRCFRLFHLCFGKSPDMAEFFCTSSLSEAKSKVIAMHRSTMWGIVKWILVALAGLGLALFAVLKVIATSENRTPSDLRPLPGRKQHVFQHSSRYKRWRQYFRFIPRRCWECLKCCYTSKED